MSKIAIVGCDASGKTVLISSLSDYYKAGRRAGQSCIMVPADGLTRRYTDNLHRVMRINGEWPEATSDIAVGTSLKWKMMRGGKEIADLELLDFGGENFRYAFRDDGTQKNPEVVAKLKEYIAGADFIVITVSMDKMLRNLTPAIYRELENGDIEYDRDSEAQWVTDGLLRMVPDKIAANPPGVVVALTQADKHREELAEHGGAKALFAKCWPTIATMYPDINVVPCASIDRMSENGLPADGYSTEGVLPVMKEFSRYAFGDGDGLCRRLEALRAMLTGLDETEASKAFVTAAADYRKTMEMLGDKTAIIGELFADKLAQYENFLANIRTREEAAQKIENAHAQDEMARQIEARKAEEAHKFEEAEEMKRRADEARAERARRRAEFVRRIGHPVRVASLLVILAALIVFGARVLQVGLPNAIRPADAPAKDSVNTQEVVRAQEAAKAQAIAKAREIERAKEAARAQELALAREKAEQERLRLENEKIKAERERAREEALRQEHARKIREAEEARKRAEAEIQKAKEKAHEAELARARLEGEVKAQAQQPAPADEKPRLSREELLRARAEEREMKYNELRERQRLDRERTETAGLMECLVDAVNKAQLERGRNLIAELSGGRKLSQGQIDTLTYAKTFMDHLEKAQNGNADDMLWIGNQYYTAKDSLGIVKSPREAFGWYQRAAKYGHSQAYYFLSLMSEQGEGSKKDEALSGRYCLKAARLGNAEAMFWTGVYFNEGTHGFTKSPATAYKFLSMARNAGFENANLNKMISRLQDYSDEETIDGLFPEDPLQGPVEPAPKAEKSWWGLGVF